MIDTRLLLDDFEQTARRLARKGVERPLVEQARHFVLKRRDAQQEVDSARHEAKQAEARIGILMRQGQREEAEAMRSEAGAARSRVTEIEAQLSVIEPELEDLLARLPNLPLDSVPDGSDESGNVVVRTHGYDPADYEGRNWAPHWELGERLGLFDAERAAKLSGAMFMVLRGDGARLLRGLTALALDMHRDTYEEILPPHLVRTEVISRTGHLTKFDTQAYRLRDDELWLIPTGEVPLMGLHQGEILAEAELPKRYMASTVCWRREAGAAGKDTRGLQRVHEFHKVELVKLCRPEDGEAELDSLLADAEKAPQVLGLPYRVVELCAGDLTFTSAKVYDIEVYSPGVDKWMEVASISLITDFQSRRGQIRFRREGGGTEYVHALNGSGLATPRILAALIEHGQQPDGSVQLPVALASYMGGSSILA